MTADLRSVHLTPPDHVPPTFSRLADSTLARVRETYTERGFQYGDSWALPNIHAPLTELVLHVRKDTDYRAWLRLLRAAVLFDTKLSRLQGADSITDSLIDATAYLAAFAELLREYQGEG